ncbi:interferon alpha-inducible protein 27-like protein 2A [Neopsephotus bourkii]|uniref:interferon alpha-inducible protein 27-like protein 2A n=1 Tax=Neopsephotus bourkii TaxID=309878 RepID=UPI002AA5A2D5|nr:interferon alpha-inducible protein 27-like protein 2A [Neopsephotus bourkii]
MPSPLAMVSKLKGAAIGATALTGVVLIGIPLAVGALGFTPAGIAAGSIAAKMMSAAAIANGGGVAAGSTVAVLQSIGAAGLPLAAKIGLTTTLGPLGAAVGAMFSKGKKPPGDDSQNSSDDDDEDSDGMEGTGKPPETPATCPPS